MRKTITYRNGLTTDGALRALLEEAEREAMI